MHIGINARTFSVEEPDGAVQVGQRLTQSLLDRNDVKITLYGDVDLEQEFNGDFRIKGTGFLSNSPFYGVIWERIVLPKLVNPNEIDILLCPNANAPIKSVGCPIVTYIHDVNAQRKMSGLFHRLYRKHVVPYGIQNSDAVLTISEFSSKEIPQFYPVSQDDIHVVYNGVDDFYLNEGASEPLKLPDNYLLYVGAMNPRKNVKKLVQSYEEIKDQIPHKLVLIGPQNKSVYQKMNIESTSDDLITPGFVPKSQLKYAYENADAFLYPSLYEGFGLPPLEAMACGTPVIASNRTSIPEIVNGAAVLVDPTKSSEISSSILEVIGNEDIQENLIEKGKKQAKKYTWEDAATNLYHVLYTIYNGYPGEQ